MDLGTPPNPSNSYWLNLMSMLKDAPLDPANRVTVNPQDAPIAPVFDNSQQLAMQTPTAAVSAPTYSGAVKKVADKGLGSIMDQIAQQQQLALAPQQQGISNLQADLTKEEEKSKKDSVLSHLNLSPLYQLADEWNHTNTAGNYQAPESQKQVEDALYLKKQKLQDLQNQMSKEQLDALKEKGAMALGLGKIEADKGLISAYKQNQDVQKGVTQYTTDLDKKGATDIFTALNRFSSLVKPYVDSNQPIPGIGGLKSHVPPMMLSQEGQQVQQAYSDLKTAMMHKTFGSRQTEVELKQMDKVLSNYTGTNNQQFLNGMKSIFDKQKTELQNFEARDPRVVNAYLSQHPEPTNAVYSKNLLPFPGTGPKKQSGLTPDEEDELKQLEAIHAGNK